MDRVDRDDVEGAATRFEAQPQLLLKRREDRRTIIR
jgi:hypothetical protein